MMITILLFLYPLGHLLRLELFPAVAIYPHDVLLALITMLAIINRPKAKFTRPLIIFSFIALTSLIIGSTQVSFLQALTGSLYLIRWFSVVGLYFFATNIPKKSAYELLLLAGSSLTVLGLIQYGLFPDLRELRLLGWDDHYYRLTSTLFDPGFTGIIIVLTILLLLKSRQLFSRNTYYIILATNFIALLLTYSRASYLAFIAGIIVLGWQKSKKLIIGIVILLAASLLFLPRPGGAGVQLTRMFSLQKRVQTWQEAVTIFRDRPAFGVGFNLLRYSKYNYKFIDNKWQTSHSAAGVENSFLFLLSTTGIVGFTAFMYLLFSIAKSNHFLAANIIAISTHAIFTNTWFYPWVMIWFWILAATARKSPSSLE